MLFLLFGACNNQPKSTIDTVELVDILMKETDYSGKWQWIDSDTYQTEDIPTESNNYLLRSTTRTLTGFYDPGHYYIRIYNRIEYYNNNPPMSSADDVTLGINGEKTFDLNFSLASQRVTLSKCVTEPVISSDTSMFCKIIVNYDRLVSIITFYAPSNIDRDEITDLIDQVLESIDKRVQQTIELPSP
jgi:hypothetical protein